MDFERRGPAPSDAGQSLTARVRAGLWLLLVAIVVFGVADMVRFRGERPLIHLLQIAQAAVHGAALVYLRRERPRRRVITAGLLGVIAAAYTGAPISITAGDATAFPLLLTVLALGASVLIPWGGGAQVITCLVVLPAVIWDVLAVDGGAAPPRVTYLVATALVLMTSVYIAATLDRARAQQTTALAALRRSEARFRGVIESSPDVVSLSARDGTITYVSASSRAVLGRDPESLVGTNMIELVHPDDRAQLLETIANSTPGPSSGNVEYRARHSDGSWIVLSAAGTNQLENNAIGAFVGFTRDVTARKQSEQALARALHDAEAASRAKTAFLAMMSHELRTPLNGVIGTTELLRGQAMTEEQRGLIDIIKRSAWSLNRLLADVLELAALEADQLQLARASFSPRACVFEAMEQLGPEAHSKALELSMRCASDVPPVVLADPVRVRQIASLLISNAVKFTERGSVTVELDTRGAPPGRITLCIAVTDTGVGLPPDDGGQIFEPFFKVDNTNTDANAGAGVGLAIARRLCQLMDGALTVDSTPGEGSRFTAVITVDAAP